jgi:hypothetical protein
MVAVQVAGLQGRFASDEMSAPTNKEEFR